MDRQWSRFSWAVKVISGTVMALMTYYIVSAAAPWIETNYFPVVGKMRITVVWPSPTTKGYSYVWAVFYKNRDCEYKDTAWYRQDKDGRREFVYLNLNPKDKTPPKTRPTGWALGGPWEVGMEPDEVRANSVVELHHQCPGQNWQTTTRWYP